MYFDRIAFCIALFIAGSYALRSYSCIYEACMSPALNGSSAIWRFKHSNAIEINDRITFDSATGIMNILPDSNCKVVKCVVFDTKLWVGHRKGGRIRERKCRIPRISPPPALCTKAKVAKGGAYLRDTTVLGECSALWGKCEGVAWCISGS